MKKIMIVSVIVSLALLVVACGPSMTGYDPDYNTIKTKSCEAVKGECLSSDSIHRCSGEKLMTMAFSCSGEEEFCCLDDTRPSSSEFMSLANIYAVVYNLAYFGIMDFDPVNTKISNAAHSIVFASDTKEIMVNKKTGIINCFSDSSTGEEICGEAFITFYKNSLIIDTEGEFHCTPVGSDSMECSGETVQSYQELKALLE